MMAMVAGAKPPFYCYDHQEEIILLIKETMKLFKK
jgi:hypothetical protein